MENLFKLIFSYYRCETQTLEVKNMDLKKNHAMGNHGIQGIDFVGI